MLNLILFGPPGCGKGTQSARVACRYNLVHLSTGELFRKEVNRNTPLGSHVAQYMNKGLLVPDHIVLRRLYYSALDHTDAPGLVFDGFPRTLHQADILDRMLNKKGIPVNIVFYMVVDEDELFSRMMGRSEDSGRDDDNEKTIRRRMEIYHQQTRPLEAYYQKQNKISRISGMAPVSVVSKRIANVVEHYLEKKEVLSLVEEY